MPNGNGKLGAWKVAVPILATIILGGATMAYQSHGKTLDKHDGRLTNCEEQVGEVRERLTGIEVDIGYVKETGKETRTDVGQTRQDVQEILSRLPR